MDSVTYNKLEYITSGSGLTSTELNEIVDLMDEYAKEHVTEALRKHGIMQGLLKQSDVSAAAKKHWSDASGSYAQEEIVQDSFEAGVWWACTQLSGSPTVGKAGGDASVSDGK